MKNFVSYSLLCAAASAALLAAAACGDEERPGATTTTSVGPTSSSAAGSTGAGTGGGGTGGSGGAGGGSSACSDAPKPLEELSGEITANKTLTADKDYVLKGIVFVNAPATLTIEPCTRILGEKVSLGTLVIEPGAKIMAPGEVDKPIVFTSQAPPGERAAGDWGGLIVLGKAPVNFPGGTGNVEGITGEGTSYGGSDANDDSGVIQYVRIEFSGILLSVDNEINGLTLAGVGAGTTVDHVMVHHTLDDCFEFFGGTVNAKHLLCAQNGDEGFDWDNGYKGKLQFLALQQDPTIADDTNGFEGDNDSAGSLNMPLSEPTIYNVTLCGKDVNVDKQQYGMLLRRSTKAHIANAIMTGFEACVDVRDASTSVELTSSICFGNSVQNIAYDETAAGMDVQKDDDNGFDEAAWFKAPASKNAETDPMIAGCFGAAPDFTPASTITTNAATPPKDGFFDETAAYIGAFKAGDTWAQGAWVSYAPN